MDRIEIKLSARPTSMLGRVLRYQTGDLLDLSGEAHADGYRVDDDWSPPNRHVISVDSRARVGSVGWHEVASLIPGMGDTNPASALSAMHERFTSEPTEANADLLQAAINQITRSPALRDRYANELEAAKNVFHTGEGLDDTTLSDNIWYEAYTDVNFGGPEFFTSMTPGWIYWRQPDFRNVRAVYSTNSEQDVISSVQFGASANEGGGQLVFFEDVQYDGRYRNYSVPVGGQQNVPWIGADFNDVASSALIIRRFPNELPPVSIAQYLTMPALSDLTGGSPYAKAVELDGRPIITWDMWPTGRRSKSDWHPDDVDRTFIEVIVPLRLRLAIDAGWASPTIHVDYRMQAKYWIFPFVRDHRFDATVAYYGYWVESGLIASYIGDALDSMVRSSVPKVRARLQATVRRVNAAAPKLNACYFLPGRNAFSGHVHDDVTLVLIRQ
jgi:hypothetical protein